uniref:Atypical chemokine receptor 2-like n=1 Tax=Astyanax mexicanus TaxID=7994 RepID=W5KXE5_ASTMX
MQRDNCSNTSQFSETPPVYKASSAVLSLCFVLGVPGNVAVLVMLVRRLKEKNFTLSLMLSLAVSDLLTLLPVPVWIWAFIHGWIFGSVVCKITAYIQYWSFYCSALCVILMSFQRFMQVLHPQTWAKLGDRGQKGLLGGIWILSGLFALYAPVQRDVQSDQHGFQLCCEQFGSDAEEVSTLFFEILLFLICFFSMVLFYYRLHRGVKESALFSCSRMTKLVTRIVVMFFILFIMAPFANSLIIIAVLLKNPNLTKIANVCGKISRALTFLNSCVNPFLYAFTLKYLRK